IKFILCFSLLFYSAFPSIHLCFSLLLPLPVSLFFSSISLALSLSLSLSLLLQSISLSLGLHALYLFPYHIVLYCIVCYSYLSSQYCFTDSYGAEIIRSIAYVTTKHLLKE